MTPVDPCARCGTDQGVAWGYCKPCNRTINAIIWRALGSDITDQDLASDLGISVDTLHARRSRMKQRASLGYEPMTARPHLRHTQTQVVPHIDGICSYCYRVLEPKRHPGNPRRVCPTIECLLGYRRRRRAYPRQSPDPLHYRTPIEEPDATTDP